MLSTLKLKLKTKKMKQLSTDHALNTKQTKKIAGGACDSETETFTGYPE